MNWSIRRIARTLGVNRRSEQRSANAAPPKCTSKVDRWLRRRRRLKLHHPIASDHRTAQLLRRVPGGLCADDGSSLVALENEPGELGSFDHYPQRHTQPRPASISTTNHPGKPPDQGSVLMVVRGQL